MSSSAIKCVFVGDGAVGKTCLLTKKATGIFPHQYVPTVFDNYAMPFTIRHKEYVLNLIDTAGQEGYETLRTVTYPDTNIFVLCFSVAIRSSFANVSEKWVPDIKKVCPDAHILLVGCQSDKRASVTSAQTTYLEGKKLAKQIGAVRYMECSALKNDGVDEVFAQAMLIAAGRSTKKLSLCSSM